MSTAAPQDPEVQAAFFCSDNRVHRWTYLRDLSKRYRCQLCLVSITKAKLKELTDDA